MTENKKWSDEPDIEQEDKRETLKNTVPCRSAVKFGRCNLETCTFAHSLQDLREPECKRGDTCDRNRCKNIHTDENREEWLKRTGFSTIFQAQKDRPFKKNVKDRLVILYTPGYSKRVHRLVDLAVQAGMTNVELVAKK